MSSSPIAGRFAFSAPILLGGLSLLLRLARR
jgi:hypothetical protein